jgi:molecular chaperone DnaK
LLEEISERTMEVLEAGGVRPSDLDVLLNVGGASRMPMVSRTLMDLFGREPTASNKPDEAVALGAALYACRIAVERGANPASISSYASNLRLVDVASRSIGIRVIDHATSNASDGRFKPILHQNSRVLEPATISVFTTRPGEESILVPIIEDDGDRGRQLGSVAVTGLPPGRPAGCPVEVTMLLDRDGVLEIAAKDINSGKMATTSIVYDVGTDPIGDPDGSVMQATLI